MDDDDPRERIRAAHAALVAEGAIEPLSEDAGETRRWLDCELASLVENRFFEPIDPLRMTPELRTRWEPRASSDEPLSSPHGQGWYRVAYWMRDGGERAGTVALATAPMGTGLVTVSSLYTLPSHRRRGIAGGFLGRAQEAFWREGLAGLRVPAYWTWQPAVRFYLGLGMWILNWKHALLFHRRRGQPEHRIEVDEGRGEARFSIVQGGAQGGAATPLLSATRDGNRLRLVELGGAGGSAVGGAGARSCEASGALETFAVALATHGFPLVRSAEAWEARWLSSDCGEPEGLACRIERWEAWERQSGYEVRTPRIPGLAYAGLP